jgi:hypothetical protein
MWHRRRYKWPKPRKEVESGDSVDKNGRFIKYRPPKEEVMNAIIESKGVVKDGAARFTRPDGTPVPEATYQGWIEQYDLAYYPAILKKHIAKMCLDKMVELGLKGDVQCLKEITRNWGQYIGFEPPTQKHESTVTHKLEAAFADYDGRDLIAMQEEEKLLEAKVEPIEVDDE